MVTGVVLQPSYIPWRGFFDLVHEADVFVFYDDVQYDKHGWRNRNRIKTAQGPQWLTIPVAAKGNVTDGLAIKDALVAKGAPWAKKHLASIRQSYAKAPFFAEVFPKLEALFAEHAGAERLADVTIGLTVGLARIVGIERTRFVRSSELGVGGGKTERLVNLMQHLGADHYLSGPSARDYIEAELFVRAGVTLDYKVYAYPEYEQLWPPYDPQVSIVDLLFMKGLDAASWIWGSKPGSQGRAT